MLVFLLSGCVVGNLAMETQVMQYSGDGVIRNSSIAISPGYQIEFPKFNAARSYEASYRLSRVPQNYRRLSTCYLRFNQPGLSWRVVQKRKNSVTATVRFRLCDENGHVLKSSQFHLSNSWWTGNRGLFGIYALEKSDLHFEPNTRYILNVSYTPGNVPPPTKQLYFSIENGGTK